MTKFFKNRKQGIKPPTPRTMEEINKEYGQKAAAYGNEQYKLEVQKRTVENMFSELLALNNEGAERQKLDAAKKAQEAADAAQKAAEAAGAKNG